MKECLFSDSKRSIVSLNQEDKLSHLSNHKSESISKSSQEKGNSFFIQCLLLLVVAFTLFITSCNKAEEPQPLSNASEQAQSLGDVVAYNPSARYSSGVDGDDARPSRIAVKKESTFLHFATDNSLLQDSRVRLYVLFYAPDGHMYPKEMNKYNSGSGVDCYWNGPLSQVGQYRFVYAYQFENSGYVSFGYSHYIDVYLPPIPLGDDYNPGNSSRYFRGYCTSWVAWKVNQMWGKTNGFPVGMGDAVYWKSKLANYGYSSDSNPRVGDIAYWTSLGHGLGQTAGHVAFVNDVQDNGNTVIITEYNYEGFNKYSSRTLYRGKDFPHAFIHVQNKK